MCLEELPPHLRQELLAAHAELKTMDRLCRESLERLRKAQAAIYAHCERATGLNFAELGALLDDPTRSPTVKP